MFWILASLGLWNYPLKEKNFADHEKKIFRKWERKNWNDQWTGYKLIITHLENIRGLAHERKQNKTKSFTTTNKQTLIETRPTNWRIRRWSVNRHKSIFFSVQSLPDMMMRIGLDWKTDVMIHFCNCFFFCSCDYKRWN